MRNLLLVLLEIKMLKLIKDYLYFSKLKSGEKYF